MGLGYVQASTWVQLGLMAAMFIDAWVMKEIDTRLIKKEQIHVCSDLVESILLYCTSRLNVAERVVRGARGLASQPSTFSEPCAVILGTGQEDYGSWAGDMCSKIRELGTP